jgi:hypothetical protein
MIYNNNTPNGFRSACWDLSRTLLTCTLSLCPDSCHINRQQPEPSYWVGQLVQVELLLVLGGCLGFLYTPTTPFHRAGTPPSINQSGDSAWTSVNMFPWLPPSHNCITFSISLTFRMRFFFLQTWFVSFHCFFLTVIVDRIIYLFHIQYRLPIFEQCPICISMSADTKKICQASLTNSTIVTLQDYEAISHPCSAYSWNAKWWHLNTSIWPGVG